MKPPADQEGPRPRGGKHDDIVHAALSCFTRQGYNNTTMDDIVAESGLSKGTLYWYFDSKEDLFQAALLSVFEEFGDGLIHGMEMCDTPTEKLRCMGQSAADFGDSVGGYFSLFLEFWHSSSHREEANQVWFELLEEYKRVLAGILDEGVETGAFRPIDSESLVWALLATYDGLAAYAGFIPDLDLPRISETFIDVLLRGIATDQVENGLPDGA